MSPKTRLISILFTSILLSFSCASTRSVRDIIEDIPAKHSENYSFSSDSLLIERLNTSAEMVMAYLTEYDDPERTYVLYDLSADERVQLETYLQLLPAHYRHVLQERLLGIYIIENFYGSGMADYVVSDSGDVFAILFLNSSVFGKSLTQLLTDKENTCFRVDDESVRVAISVSDKYTGLFYILMHECTHILDYVERITPYVEPNMLELQGEAPDPSAFTTKYWDGYHTLRDPIRMEYRDRLTFYRSDDTEKISNTEMAAVYSALKQTPFASLYGCLTWAEDLAEYATMYHVTQNLNMDYIIRIYENADVIY